MEKIDEIYRVIIHKEINDPAFMGFYTAQILERDIVVQGKDIKELMSMLLLTIQLEYESHNLLKIARAPDSFFKEYECLLDGHDMLFENEKVRLDFRLRKDF